MARLILRALAFVALLGGSTAALAEPVTGIVLFTIAGTAVTVGTVLFVLTTAVSIYGSIQTKKKARAAAQRAAEREAANLKDRTTTVLASDAPWPVIYGQPAPVGGSIVALFTSGADDRFKHIVYVLAAHECDGVAAIYIGGDSVGALSPSGYASAPAFALEGGVPQTETRTFELASVPITDPLGNGDGSPAMSEEGYWYFPFGFDADGFELVSIRHTDGSPYDGSVRVGMAPNTEGGRSLIGPIGATGSVTYIVNGAGSAVNVQIHLSPGGVDTADAFLRGARPDLWTVDHKLSSCTYLVVTLNLLLDRFQGGIPEITAQLRGKKVYDYRTGQTAYSRNPALCLADFIRSEAGYGADAAQIDVDAVVAAANACQVGVYDFATVEADPATYGFLQARYTCDGMFRTDQDRDATRQQIEDAMCGASLESGGVWRILAGAWTTPVLALTDDDMVMPISIVQTCNVGTARYNGMKGTYVNATRLGVTEDFTPYQNPVFRAQDVKDKYLDTALSFTGNHIRTQQIARVLVEQSRGGFVVQVHPKMFAWNLQPGDRIVLSSLLFGFTNKTFRVQDWTYQAGTPVALQCVEDEEAFYDQADEVRADAAPNTQLPSPFLKPGAPLDLTVESGEEHMVQQDGVMVVRTRVAWLISQDAVVRQAGVVRVQWRPMGGSTEWQSADLPGDSTIAYLLALAVNEIYVIRVQFQTAYASSPWSVVQHMVRGVEGPPANVMGFGVRVEPSGIVARWNEPVGIDLLGWSATQVRRGPTWTLAEAATLFDGRATSANLGWFPSGVWSVWAAHCSTTKRWSEPVMSLLEILVPGQPVVTGEAWRDQVELAWTECTTTQPLLGYEIRIGNIYASAPVVTFVNALGYVRTESEPGRRLYWVTPIDVAGNRGAPGYKEVETLPSIDVALGKLQEGLDDVVLDLTQLGDGIDQRLLAEVAARGTAIDQVEELVTAGDERLAQRIETVSATAVGYIRGNVIYNGGFEYDKERWVGSIASFGAYESIFGRIAQSSTHPANGRIWSPTGPAAPGLWYAAAADVQAYASSVQWSLGVHFYDAAANEVAGGLLGKTGSTVDLGDASMARRQEYAVEAKAPAGTAFVRMSFGWANAAGGLLALRHAKVEQGRKPITSYVTGAADAGTLAAIQKEATARATSDAAEATARETLAARVGAVQASVVQESTVRANEMGALKVRYGVRLSAGGKVSGVVMNNDGQQSDFVVLSDRFAWATEINNEVKYPVVFGQIGGVPSFGFSGNMYLDKVLKARMIDAEQIYGTHIRGEEIEARHLKAGSITTEKLNVGLGSNLLANSTWLTRRFEGLRPGHLPAGWNFYTTVGESPGSTTWDVSAITPSNNWAGYIPSQGQGFVIIQYQPNSGASWGLYTDVVVAAGKRYAASVYAGAHRALCDVSLEFYNAANQNLPAPITNFVANAAEAPGGKGIADFKRIGCFAVAPAGTMYARMVIWKRGTIADQSSSYGFFTQPMLEEATVYQTVFSAYQPSGIGVQITPTGIATPSLSALSATIGWLETAASGGRVQVRDNVVKVFDANNVLRVQLGNLDL